MVSADRRAAFITGATSGIGCVFARRFAEQGYDLILTGRRKEKIESLANELSEGHKIDVEIIIAELSDEKKVDFLAGKIKTLKHLEILVNNAGFGKENYFHLEDFSTHQAMMKVHNGALIKLCHAAVPNMVWRGKGKIINVSSMSAFIPFPRNAIYAATKSFVKIFTESIHLELRGTGVKVQALCPGMTRTDFHKRLGFDHNTFYKDKGIMKSMRPEEVVDISLKYLEKDKVLCVPGWNNKLSRFLLKLLPQPAVYGIASSLSHENM